MSNLVFFNGKPSEETLLRSTLVYNKVRRQVSRDDIVEKAMYASIIMYSYVGKPIIDYKELIQIVCSNYHCELQEAEIKAKLDKLKGEKLINHDNYKEIRLSTDINIEDNLTQIETNSENLVDAVCNKAEQIYSRPVPNKQIVKGKIRQAITYYLRETYLEFFDLQREKTAEEREDIIKSTFNSLGDKIGEATIRALSEILLNPTDEQQKVILEWSKAFLTLQIMDLDPKLNEFKKTKFAQKSFVIDTDVALHCLCNNTRKSKSYKELINQLQKVGCKLYIPEQVKKEINKHIDAAIRWGGSYGDQLLQFTDETLEGTICNAFIEDYVKTYRKDKEEGRKCMPFGVYIGNLRADNDSSVFYDKLCITFGNENVRRQFDISAINERVLETLTRSIHDKTLQTIKADKRTDEENFEIAHNDALMYLVVKRMNEGIDGNNFFSYKTYILTNSNRTKRSALEVEGYEKEIICNPNSLYALLDEIGDIKSEQTNLLDIIDNPYMRYVAKKIWNQIEPILHQNQAIQFQTINKLKSSVNISLDELLTSQNAEETIQILKKFGDNSLFGRDVLDLRKKVDEKQKEIDRQQIEIDKLKAEKAALEAEKRKKDNRRRYHFNGIQRNSSPPKKHNK